MLSSRLTRTADATLGYTLLVILWGAFVRATGSGAGCGSHWPTCNGEIIPRAASTATLIEYGHRLTSGLALLAVIVLVRVARRETPPDHSARRFAYASLFFMLTEAAVGAGLVLFEKVAHDASIGRAYWMSAHLINTLFLVGSMALCSWAARHASSRRPQLLPATQRWLLGSAIVAMLLVGVSGAIAALGDTLFPASSLREGLRADLHPDAHPFIKLRAWHPFLAVGTALLLFGTASSFAKHKDSLVRGSAQRLVGLTLLQVAVGLVNLLLMAPVAMQLIHLLVADALWIALLWLLMHSRSQLATTRA